MILHRQFVRNSCLLPEISKFMFLKKYLLVYIVHDCCAKFRCFAFKSNSLNRGGFLIRNFGSGTWIDYFSGKSTRPINPRVNEHAMLRGFENLILNNFGVAIIVAVVKRFKWGSTLDAQLDKLGFVPSMNHIILALKLVSDYHGSLSLFRWAKRQPWYSPDGECYNILFDRLIHNRDHDGIQALFDEMILDSCHNGVYSFTGYSYSQVIQYLATDEKLEASFSSLKRLCESGFKLDAKSCNLLITLFLNKGLPSKAFEIYETQEEAKCSLDNAAYELMILSMAKSGRIQAAYEIFQEMKANNFRPSYTIFASLVDSMGKGGWLDMSIKLYMEMKGFGMRASKPMYVSLIDSFVKAGKLDAGFQIWEEMKTDGIKPSFGLYTMIIESYAKSGKVDIATSVLEQMEKSGFVPTSSTYSCLLEMLSGSQKVVSAMKLYDSMTTAGLKPSPSAFPPLVTLFAKSKLVEVAARTLLDMKSLRIPIDVVGNDVLMVFVNDGSIDIALRWLNFMSSSRIHGSSIIIRQLFESCMRNGLYEPAKPVLEHYLVCSKVDLVLYTSILSHLVRSETPENEKLLMSIISSTKHDAHSFICGLLTGPERRKLAVLPFVREFFETINHVTQLGAARFFSNVLLNYLVLMGQINRARCVWKVAYENRIFPKAIVFDRDVCWSVDVRKLSVGAALIAVSHSLHRFRKRILYYGFTPRRIKLVTGLKLKYVVARMLIGSPFEICEVVLKARGGNVKEWFKKPLIQQLILNEIPSRTDILMHRLNVSFPNSAPEIRELSRPNLLLKGK